MARGTVSHLLSAQVSSSKTDVPGAPTYIAKISLGNTTAAIAYVQIFFLAAASVTLGTTVPDVVLQVPASGGREIDFPDEGWHPGGTTWCMAGTTTRTGNTSAAVDVTLFKKN